MSTTLAPLNARIDAHPPSTPQGGIHHRDARGMASLLVVVAVLVSAWPLQPLFDEASWTDPLITTLATTAGLGALVRALAPRRRGYALLVPSVQLLGLVGVLCLYFGAHTTLAGVIPTADTWNVARQLYADAVGTITTYPAPAPATPGIAFVFAAGFGAVGLLADLIGVTLARPLLATVPLLVPYLAAVANVDSPLPWFHVAALIGALAALVFEARRHQLLGWAGVHEGHTDQYATAIMLTVAAVVVALTAASAVPHLSTRYLADGLGRQRAGLAKVGFSPDPDLISDLRSGDTTPVLRYTTDDALPPPVRVSVTSNFDGGRWVAAPPRTSASDSPQLSAPLGLSADVETIAHTFTVDETRLDAPWLAAPAPVTGGRVAGARWDQDPLTQTLVVDTRPAHYSTTYVTATGGVGGDRMGDTRQLLRSSHITADDLDTSAVTPLLSTTVSEITESSSTPAERADAIQSWLRDEGRFTYTLDFPVVPEDSTAIDVFLTSRRGYCVQFATAMVLMAREQGIPARLATGFLPGTREGDSRIVRAADAHAWPELYLNDLGWVHYEPTPSIRSGLAPDNGAIQREPAPDESEVLPTARPSATDMAMPSPSRVPREDDRGLRDPGAGAGAAKRDTGVPAVVGAVGLGVPLLALILAASPLTALWRHRRRLQRAQDARGRMNERWRWLTLRLADLGIAASPSATVRGCGEAYAAALGPASDTQHAPSLSGSSMPGSPLPDTSGLDRSRRHAEAIARLVDTVETARYAPTPPADAVVAACAEDVRHLIRAAWRRADLRTRVVAVLAPSGGLVPRRDRRSPSV